MYSSPSLTLYPSGWTSSVFVLRTPHLSAAKPVNKTSSRWKKGRRRDSKYRQDQVERGRRKL